MVLSLFRLQSSPLKMPALSFYSLFAYGKIIEQFSVGKNSETPPQCFWLYGFLLEVSGFVLWTIHMCLHTLAYNKIGKLTPMQYFTAPWLRICALESFQSERIKNRWRAGHRLVIYRQINAWMTGIVLFFVWFFLLISGRSRMDLCSLTMWLLGRWLTSVIKLAVVKPFEKKLPIVWKQHLKNDYFESSVVTYGWDL